MPRGKTSGGKRSKRPIERYEHKGKKRINNPPVGLVTPETDPVAPTHKTYEYITPVPSVKPRQELDYDPHLDPQLVWAGKKEHTSFEVHTVSLHVHERIEPHTIIEAMRKRNGSGTPEQPSLFESREENPPLREAIDFYRYPHGWSNRLIAGDSLLVMNSLLEKEGMAGQVQMVYIDPPYGKTYNSNFQPFVNKRDVKDGKDEDLTQEPEMIRAFRDTWELGIHSYLTYLRDRLLLALDLVHESGSCFLQMGEENIHVARDIMDEIFGTKNFVSVISFSTTTGFESLALPRAGDYLLWYARDRTKLKYRRLFRAAERSPGDGGYRWIEVEDGTTRSLSAAELRGDEPFPIGARLYNPDNLISQGAAGQAQPFKFGGKTYEPPASSHWKANYPDGMHRLAFANRLHVSENSLRYIRKADDFPWRDRNNLWTDTLTGSSQSPKSMLFKPTPRFCSAAC
jgi:adenine-specific DNA-methyltransferase